MTDHKLELTEADLDTVTGGSKDQEMSMISLQSVVSQRSNMVALVSSIMGSMNDATKSIIGNIR